jgi:hypothetical protein
MAVARLAAAEAVGSEASLRTALEAAVKSVEDCATAAQSAAADAVSERVFVEASLAKGVSNRMS